VGPGVAPRGNSCVASEPARTFAAPSPPGNVVAEGAERCRLSLLERNPWSATREYSDKVHRLRRHAPSIRPGSLDEPIPKATLPMASPPGLLRPLLLPWGMDPRESRCLRKS